MMRRTLAVGLCASDWPPVAAKPKPQVYRHAAGRHGRAPQPPAPPKPLPDPSQR